jgi:hypothetical protein
MMMFIRILFKRQAPGELESLSQVAKQKSSRKEDNSQDHAIYDLIKATAIFKARLKVLDPDKSDIVHDKINYRYNVRNWNFNDGEGTLAVSRQTRSVRYIVSNLNSSQISAANNYRNGRATPPRMEKTASKLKEISRGLPFFSLATPSQPKFAPEGAWEFSKIHRIRGMV